MTEESKFACSKEVRDVLDALPAPSAGAIVLLLRAFAENPPGPEIPVVPVLHGPYTSAVVAPSTILKALAAVDGGGAAVAHFSAFWTDEAGAAAAMTVLHLAPGSVAPGSSALMFLNTGGGWNTVSPEEARRRLDILPGRMAALDALGEKALEPLRKFLESAQSAGPAGEPAEFFVKKEGTAESPKVSEPIFD